MNQLFAIYDSLSNGYTVECLDVFSVIALFFGIGVLSNKNPIASLMCLIGLFAFISIYLILLGLTYIGFSYLIVYIGAVSILFLFILMLIDIRTSELQSNNKNSISLAIFVTIFLNYTLYELLPYYITIINSYNNKIGNIIHNLPRNIYINIATGERVPLFSPTLLVVDEGVERVENLDVTALDVAAKEYKGNVMFVTSNSWDGNMTETSHISTIGNMLYTSYNLWLFIASVILLLSMIGAIIITIKQDNRNE